MVYSGEVLQQFWYTEMRNGWTEKPILGLDPISAALIGSGSSVWTKGELLVLYTPVEPQPDGLWKHASVSREDHYPSWDEILDVRYTFFDDDNDVFQVLPLKKEDINVHKNCFHLWSPIGRRVTPG